MMKKQTLLFTLALFSMGAIILHFPQDVSSQSSEAKPFVLPKTCATATHKELNEIGAFTSKNLNKLQQDIVTKSFMITDPLILNSQEAKTGSWSFKHSMIQLAGGDVTKARKLTKDWLDQWMSEQTANQSKIPPRTGIKSVIIETWKTRDKHQAGTNWLPNLDNAPFKLLAIVNRMDLHEANEDFSKVHNAGEGRFVYGFVTHDKNGKEEPIQRGKRMTIILEYRLVASSKKDLLGWIEQWLALSSHKTFDQNYRTALKAITNKFSNALSTPAQRKDPKAAPFQLRTNEIVLGLASGSPTWELREFNIDPKNRKISSVTVKQSPGEAYRQAFGSNTSASLALRTKLIEYLRDNQAQILKKTHSIPLQWKNTPFLAARSITPSPRFSWSNIIHCNQLTGELKKTCETKIKSNTKLLKAFSIETCNGCHGGDAAALTDAKTPFQHIRIKPTHPSPTNGMQAELSTFLIANGKKPVRLKSIIF